MIELRRIVSTYNCTGVTSVSTSLAVLIFSFKNRKACPLISWMRAELMFNIFLLWTNFEDNDGEDSEY